jgi:anion-transporting  ArsA/GET3 family ATPase
VAPVSSFNRCRLGIRVAVANEDGATIVTPGHVQDGVVAFRGSRQRAEAVTALLRADATRFILVASPQHDTLNEAGWFADQLVGQGFAVHGTVTTRRPPRCGDGPAPHATNRAKTAAGRGHEDLAAVWNNLAELRTIADAERAELAPLLERVADSAVVEVPLLPSDVHDTEALDVLAQHLFA